MLICQISCQGNKKCNQGCRRPSDFHSKQSLEILLQTNFLISYLQVSSSAKDLRTQFIISPNRYLGCQCALALDLPKWFKAKLILTHSIYALGFKCKCISAEAIDDATLILWIYNFCSPKLLFWMANIAFRINQNASSNILSFSHLLSRYKKKKIRQRRQHEESPNINYPSSLPRFLCRLLSISTLWR